MKMTEILMNKPAYLGLSIVELSKTKIWRKWKIVLCGYSFIVHIKTDDIYKDITVKDDFVGLKAKSYSYLIDDGSEDKKAKGTKKSVIKRNLDTAQLGNKINHLEKNEFDKNEEFELRDRLYSVPDIQDYFEYILKKHRENRYPFNKNIHK